MQCDRVRAEAQGRATVSLSSTYHEVVTTASGRGWGGVRAIGDGQHGGGSRVGEAGAVVPLGE